MDGFMRRLRQLAAKFPKRSPGYWFGALVVLAVILWTEPFIDAKLNLADERNWAFEHFAQSVTNPALPRDVKLVLIGDDEYWDGDLHHRSPTDRSYIARLVQALDVANAQVIALDFDLRLPHPNDVATPGRYAVVDAYKPYRDETDLLVKAIDDVAQRRKIVLSRTISGKVDGPFDFESDAYQAYGLCTRLHADGQWDNPGTPEFPLTAEARQNISCGYIALMTDKRRVPPPARINGQSERLDAFPLAIVRAWDQSAVPRLESGTYYASYIRQDVIRNPRITMSAGSLLGDPAKARSILGGKPVIVGAAWSQRAKGRGGQVDLHDTPIGKVSGPVIYENVAEAVLSNRALRGLDEHALWWLELLVGMAAAVIFAAFSDFRMRVVVVVAAIALMFVAQWMILQLFGTFFDAFVPVVGLGLHAIGTRLAGEPNEKAATA